MKETKAIPLHVEHYLEQKLDLHEHLVRNHPATFIVRASGDSMARAGIMDGDLLVVDRALVPDNGCVVIAALDGELTVKYLEQKDGRVLLAPGDDASPALDVTEEEEPVWGVVTYAIHQINAHVQRTIVDCKSSCAPREGLCGLKGGRSQGQDMTTT